MPLDAIKSAVHISNSLLNCKQEWAHASLEDTNKLQQQVLQIPIVSKPEPKASFLFPQ